MELVERMKKIQKKAGAAFKKVQKDIKQQADRKRKEVEK